jgi:hypothetical protein
VFLGNARLVIFDHCLRKSIVKVVTACLSRVELISVNDKTMNGTENEILFHPDKVCRLCLSRKRAMLSIFYEDGTSFPIVSRICTYIGIEVSFVFFY